MIIKAGTYRWNDTVNFVSNIANIIYPLPFTTNEYSTTIEDEKLDFGGSFDAIQIEEDGTIWYGTHSETSSDGYGFQCQYDTTDKWNWFYVGMLMGGYDIPELKGITQTITVTEDTEVDDTFGTWFTDNTKPIGADTPAVEITYKDKVITLNAGETVTLHTAEKKLTEDLVIKANEVASGSGEDSPLPIEISSESAMNALLATAEVGAVYKYTGTTGTYENGALYVVEESE